ncbi:MAG: tRNA pseudouridine(38-40) synthase TruA [Candidatus Eisenbacteria sp.]|nr:tRNA pseudouridine(38-40) synthase TruA [Candidatus Eisenbacteria bacterium]
MRTIRLDLAYDGSGFHGWQRQPGLRTVQGELERALATLLREPVSLVGAGRTDAGVHALGQVASFRTRGGLSLRRIARGCEALAGRDIVVRRALEVVPEFHARYRAVARHYLYLLQRERSPFWDHRCLHPHPWPELEQMNGAVQALVGDHDFAPCSCRTPDERGTRSHVFYARWEPWERGAVLRIGAVRFLYKMVRAIVALSLQIGQGRLPVMALADRLQAGTGRATSVAAAHGLHLAAVDYPEAAGDGFRGLDCEPPKPVL